MVRQISPTSVRPWHTMNQKFPPLPTLWNTFFQVVRLFFPLLFAICSKRLPDFSHLIPSTLSPLHFPFTSIPSFLFPLHYSCCPQINHGSNTPPSPPPCSLSLFILNPSLTTQLFCLWRISARWVVYVCMRPNVNSPISVRFWENYSAAAPKHRSPLSTVMLTHIHSPKKLQNYHHHNQPAARVTWQMKNKSLLGTIGGIIQMRFFKQHDTHFFDIKCIESVFYPGHSW